jgi:voltage-gated potassium channel Kch
VHLSVFIFIMTGIVYETQHAINPQINNYADALYFTVTALTTTGFGDITLAGTIGRLISVVIMVLGVTLFLNLARALLQPSKGALPVPKLRIAAPRLQRGALQSLRYAPQHSGRRVSAIAAARVPCQSTSVEPATRHRA